MQQILVFPAENVKMSVHWEISKLKMASQIGETIVPIAWPAFVDVQKRLSNMAKILMTG